ncbi:hypothetical protein [Lentzea sp. CA-135723]|uniref:hypothetical protein n=1 Tax=Lentzea sp. CA-135723 TaxID=3239950 RepID=UPI003D8BB3D9
MVLIGLGAVLLALVLFGVWPETAGQYRSAVESSVQDALSSVGTAALVRRTSQDGGTLSPYESTALDDARESVTTALSQVLDSEAPDEDSRRLRAEVVPLLEESAQLIGDAGRTEELSALAAKLGTVLAGLR